MQTMGKSKIDTIIEQSKIGNPDAVKEIIDVEINKMRREFDKEFLKKVSIIVLGKKKYTTNCNCYLSVCNYRSQELSLKMEFQKLLREQLRKQAEVHADHLEEVIQMKNREAERLLKQNVNEKIEDMRVNYNRQLAKIIGRMKGLDFALKGRNMDIIMVFPSGYIF